MKATDGCWVRPFFLRLAIVAHGGLSPAAPRPRLRDSSRLRSCAEFPVGVRRERRRNWGLPGASSPCAESAPAVPADGNGNYHAEDEAGVLRLCWLRAHVSDDPPWRVPVRVGDNGSEERARSWGTGPPHHVRPPVSSQPLAQSQPHRVTPRLLLGPAQPAAAARASASQPAQLFPALCRLNLPPCVSRAVTYLSALWPGPVTPVGVDDTSLDRWVPVTWSPRRRWKGREAEHRACAPLSRGLEGPMTFSVEKT